ncbi:MAG TPA: hypothetical protein VEZ11_14900 [Thermoanaerobaculia bacterium]|nr:hypothetical protein [Thermoanaerobaculia bacterium]
MNRTLRLRASLTVALASLLLLAIARPIQAGLSEIARAIESRYSIRRTSIPFFGLARFAVHVIHPDGVHDVQLATFEGANLDSFNDLAALVRANAGGGFSPMVESHERNGDWTLIYGRPLAKDLVELLIVAHERNDTTLVQVTINASQMEKAISDKRHGKDMWQ